MNVNENTLGRALAQREKRLPRRVRNVLSLLEGLEGGSISMSLPGGDTVHLGRGEHVAHWAVKDLAMFDRIIATGDIGLGEAWMDGLWHSHHLPELLTLLARNRTRLGARVYGQGLSLLACRIWHLLRANTRAGSRRNIEAHYDLGNDFYRLWLDPSMTYSAACFDNPDESLASAQRRKYRRILDMMEARAGQHVLEIGCGWGGFAEVAVTEYDCKVTGLTLSPSQLAYAQARAERGGWADRAEFVLRDYRDEHGQYDHVASIEMIEAVGEQFWPTYFEQVSRCLAPEGTAVIQAITIDDGLFARYRRGTDFIQRYIFPGGMLPSPSRMDAHAGDAGLAPVGRFRFGRDYARTLRQWDTAFANAREAVLAQGFDERFVRMWHFYLAYCEAGFLAGDIDVCHAAYAHGGRK